MARHHKFSFDAFVSDDRGLGLAHTPLPYGIRLRPVWFSRHFGRAVLCPEHTPDSPLHHSDRTCPTEVLVVRPDLLQLASRDILAESDDEATRANQDLLHEELMQIDRAHTAHGGGYLSSSEANRAAPAAAHPTGPDILLPDVDEDEGVILMQHAPLLLPPVSRHMPLPPNCQHPFAWHQGRRTMTLSATLHNCPMLQPAELPALPPLCPPEPFLLLSPILKSWTLRAEALLLQPCHARRVSISSLFLMCSFRRALCENGPTGLRPIAIA